MKKIIFGILACLASITVHAQIGYQVSLLNTATGEPRANVTVNATVTITNAENGLIYTGTQKATSNDFGVLSLTVGNADTFKNVDFTKLPFFIAVSIDGTLIGKSQILSVPVAEAAKTLIPSISLDELCGKEWIFEYDDIDCRYMKFERDGTCAMWAIYGNYPEYSGISVSGSYEIIGNWIIFFTNKDNRLHIYSFYLHNGKLWKETVY